MAVSLSQKIARRLGRAVSADKIASDGTTEASSVNVYANPNNFSFSGNTTGDLAWDSSNDRLYIWDSAGWYKVAVGDPV